jgi:acetyl esterase/lipase
MPSGAPGARGGGRLVALVLLATATATAGLAACGSPDQQAAPTQPAAAPTTTTAPPPDEQVLDRTLDAPRVGAGTCAEVTVTPPGAPTPADARLCIPPTDAPRRDTGVVLVHGGGGTSGSPEALTPWEEAYNEAGYPTLNVGYELFRAGDDAPVFPRPEQDVKAAVQFLRGIGGDLGIATDHVLVHGFSAGARLGAVAYTTPGDPTFAADDELWEGIADRVDGFIGFYHPYDGSLQNASTYYGGQRDDPETAVRARWVLADALLHAADASGPALLLTGEEDWDVQIAQQEEMVDLLEDAGLEAEAHVVPNVGHGFDAANGALTRSGQGAATTVLDWIEDAFPLSG